MFGSITGIAGLKLVCMPELWYHYGMNVIDEITIRHPKLAACSGDIERACDTLIKTFAEDNRLYICGNGGSAADALHITGELAKSFVRERPLDESFIRRVKEQAVDTGLLGNLQGALPAFALVENTSLATAFANDCSPGFVFAQQIYAYAREGDCVWGISTSGNSKNIIHALTAARGRGATTLGLTGACGGKMKDYCDVCICVPETETYKIQELHLPVYHAICMILEQHFWGDCDAG